MWTQEGNAPPRGGLARGWTARRGKLCSTPALRRKARRLAAYLSQRAEDACPGPDDGEGEGETVR
jgi:hypothetical protein